MVQTELFFSNIINIYVSIFQEVGIPSQIKCKGSLPKYFEEFASASIAMNATEVIQDAPSGMNCQSLS